jgi:hypothetical protein
MTWNALKRPTTDMLHRAAELPEGSNWIATDEGLGIAGVNLFSALEKNNRLDLLLRQLEWERFERMQRLRRMR